MELFVPPPPPSSNQGINVENVEKTKLFNSHGLGQPVNLLRNHGFWTSLSMGNWAEKDQNIPKDPVSNLVNV